MMKKFTILITTVILGAMQVLSQQLPMYSFYMNNMQSFNPAYVGSKDVMSIALLSRQQWVGLDGAPVTQLFLMDTPIPRTGLGAGLSILQDKVGPVVETGISVDIAYHIKVSEKGKLGMGIKSSMNFININLNSLQINDEDDQLFLSDSKSSLLPNFGTGTYYYTPDYYLGICIPKLIKNKIVDNELTGVEHVGKEERHYYFVAGAVIPLNETIKLKPSAIAKYVANAPLSFDLTVNAIILDRISPGIMYRYHESAGINIQYFFTENLRAGYAFDYAFSFARTSHELFLRYDLVLSKTKKNYVSPRYF